MLSAVVFIHRTNRIHRDIKSANVLVDSDGNVKLTDFGLAAQLTTEFTQRSTVLGTADFMVDNERTSNTIFRLICFCRHRKSSSVSSTASKWTCGRWACL